MSSYDDVKKPRNSNNSQQQQQERAVPDNWDASHIQSLQGKVVIVTGGSSGIGLETVLELACKGAHVVVACPTQHRARDAEERIRKAVLAAAMPANATAGDELADSAQRGSIEYMKLDLSDLKSVKSFARKFIKTHSRLDILINNAGIMGVSYALTVDGMERQFATNYLGHFALTHYLLGILQRTEGVSRVVSISSLSHRFVQLDAHGEMMSSKENYLAMVAYGKSKLCNLVFAVELDRRLKAQGIKNVVSVACHPGYAYTNIMGPPSVSSNWFGRAFWTFWSFSPFSQSAAMGALPPLYTATAPGVQGGDFYGPSSSFFGMWGHPSREEPAEHAKCRKTAAKLWAQSERLAKLKFDFKTSGSPLHRASSS